MSLSLETFKRMLGVDIDDISDDLFIEYVLNSAKSFVERELNILLTQQQNLTFKQKGNDSAYLFLKKRPVNSISSIKEKMIVIEPLSTPNIQTCDITEYVEIDDNDYGVLFYKGRFKAGFEYEITGDFGYIDIPDDLKYAIYQIGVKMFSISDTVKNNASRVATPDGTIVFSFDLVPEGVQGILDKYRMKI